MKQTRKVLCIIGVGLISVLLAVSTVYACCGMYPEVTNDPVVPGCPGDPVTISGTISSQDIWLVDNPGDPQADPPVPPTSSYSTNADVEIEVESPSGVVTLLTVTLSNLVEVPGDPGDPTADPPIPPTGRSATWDFSATYTPIEPGEYTYTKIGSWTTDFGTEDTDAFVGTFVVPLCDVEIDIKPGSCPNPFNAKSKGTVPVAIVGSAEVDVTTIDPATIQLEGVVPLRWSIEDVTEPGGYDPEDCFDCFEEPDPIYDADGNLIWQYSGDGILDLVLHFDTQELAAAIGTAERDECVVLTLTGDLKDGTPIEPASDSVIIKTKIK